MACWRHTFAATGLDDDSNYAATIGHGGGGGGGDGGGGGKGDAG
jgi:hypothetical protein